MLPLELHRPFEERFRRDGEELGLIGRAVGVEHGRSPRGGVLPKSLVLRAEDTGPGPKRGRREQRRPVSLAILLVQLMRELVQHDVAPIGRVARSADDVVPGDHYDAAPPGFAAEWRGLFHDPGKVPAEDVLRDDSVRIDQHRPQRRVTKTFQAEEQETCFGRDRHFHRVGDGEAGASFEVLLGDEDLHEPQQALTLGRAQAAREGYVTLENVIPGGGDRLRAERDPRAPRDASQQPRYRYVPADEAREADEHHLEQVAHGVDDIPLARRRYGAVGCATSRMRLSAMSNCPSGVAPSGASASTIAKRRRRSGSRIAWAAN